MTLNGLDCPIQLKVCFIYYENRTQGTLKTIKKKSFLSFLYAWRAYVLAFGAGHASLNEHGP